MPKRYYNCPNDTKTTDSDKYANAWRSLGKRAEHFFPGYTARQFNPHLVLELREEFIDLSGEKVYKTIDTLYLSVQALNALEKGIEANYEKK